MSKQLTIILGAGASHSLNSTESKALDNQKYRPPLTKDIFSGSGEFRTILHKYPLAEVLASDIDRRIRQDERGVSLEQILRSYEEEGENNQLIARQFLQIPLYLNDLFGEISTHFTKQPDEYNVLVNKVLGAVDQALFLTLNYDNLLEIPLSTISGVDFSSEDHYVSDEQWRLVKMHGSVNWYRSFQSYQHTEANSKEYFSHLQRTELPLKLDDRYRFIEMRGHAHQFIDNVPVYPAITVPVDGKYDPNAPESHLRAAREFLGTSTKYLVIGTSGKDKDLLDLLKETARSGDVLIVGKDEEGVTETKYNFQEGVPQFRSRMAGHFDGAGLTSFVYGGKLDEFLDGSWGG